MIEHNIHQIWVGNKRIPNHVKNYMDRVKNHHTDFNYYFWNDDCTGLERYHRHISN
jgi:mannosyltransferase OCH1-like enzyme